ncbi:MAG: C39 family peptidase [Candidatus Dormiibacterota bacterium]
MVHLRRGTATIVALCVGAVSLASIPVTAEAAMFRLPVGTQRMQMPLDCEATSLTIALGSVGVHTIQQYVQGHFPTDTRAPVLGADGLPSRWGDPYTAFVGHVMGSEPASNPHWTAYAGWGAYAPVVARAAESLGVPVAAQLTGWNPAALYAAVEAGHPVLVWTTVDYSSQTARSWTAWDGTTVPWTEAGHVVVLMGVDTSAGTLEFSDPLTGSYNGTTMAQFARTFTIYGSMAIVVERTARTATPHPIVRHVVTAVHHAAPVVVVHPTPTPIPQIREHPGITSNGFDTADSAGIGPVSVGVLSGVTATPTRGTGLSPLLIAAGVLLVAAGGFLAVLMRRRRRQCAG